MADQPRVQEFGSEIEDILSGEISIDRFYSAEISKHVSHSPRQKLLEDEEIVVLVNLANPFGNDDDTQLGDITVLSRRVLLTAYSKFLTTTEFDKMHLVLRGFAAYLNQHAPKAFLPIATFEINRAHAMGYYKEFKYANAIKYLNPAVSQCPRHRESFVGGLSDTLILLAECYSAIGRRDDALHSARLAVNISHERLEQYNKESHFSATSEDLPIFEGPVLTCFHSVILSYCTLASELEKSGMGHLSSDWYQRAYQVASKFFLESSILQELKKLIDLSVTNYNNINSNNNNNNSNNITGNNSGQVSQRDNFSNHPNANQVISTSGNATPSNNMILTTTSDENNYHSTPNNGTNYPSVDKTSSRARPRSALPRLVKENTKDDVISTMDESNTYNNTMSLKPFQAINNSMNGANGGASNVYGVSNDVISNAVSNDFDQPRPKSAISKLGGGYQQPILPLHQYNPQIYSNHPPAAFTPITGLPPTQWMVGSSPIGKFSSQQQPYPYQTYPNPYYPPYDSHQIQAMQLQQYYQTPSNQPSKPSSPTSAPRYVPPLDTNPGRYVPPYQGFANFQPGPSSPPSPTASTQPFPFHQLQSTVPPHTNEGDNIRTQRLFASQSTPLINPSMHSIVLLPSRSAGKLPDAGIAALDSGKKPMSAKKAPTEPRKTRAAELMLKKSKKDKQSLMDQILLSSTSRPPESSLATSSKRSNSNANSERNEDGNAISIQNNNQKTEKKPQQKMNKTLVSKIIAETKPNQQPQHPGTETKKSVPAESNNPPHQSRLGVVPPPPTANPLLAIDEFGREKLRKIADMCFPYFKGMRVEAKYQVTRIGDRGRWYPGRIVKADFLQGLYDIEFENGDREKNISVENIRIPEYASKLLLLQSTTKSLLNTTKSKKKEDGGDDNNNQNDNNGANNNGGEHTIPARVLRKQYEEEMHSNTLKLLAGINQRSDQRKIERILLKNQLIVKIQSLIRGVLLRQHFPKLSKQLLKEKELRQKEKELLSMQQQFYITSSSSPMVSSPTGKKASTGTMTEAVTAEVQTGLSLVMGGVGPMNIEEDEDDRIMFVDPTSNGNHPNGYSSPKNNAYSHPNIQLETNQLLYNTNTTTSNTNMGASYLETPIETPHQYHYNYDNSDYQNQQNQHREQQILNYSRQNDLVLQDRLQEIDRINDALYQIQEEQRTLKELDELRNQDLLDQFSHLHNLLIQQMEEIQSWKQIRLQQSQQSSQQRYHNNANEENNDNNNNNNNDDKKQELQVYLQSMSFTSSNNQPHPLLPLTTSAPLSPTSPTTRLSAATSPKLSSVKHIEPPTTLSVTNSLELSKDDRNQATSGGGGVTFTASTTLPPDRASTTTQSPLSNKPLQGSTGSILLVGEGNGVVSMENSIIKSEDMRLLEEYGQLGVEDFWNSVSSTEYIPFTGTTPRNNAMNAVNNGYSNGSSHNNSSHAITTQVSANYVRNVVSLATDSASGKQSKLPGVNPMKPMNGNHHLNEVSVDFDEMDKSILGNTNHTKHNDNEEEDDSYIQRIPFALDDIPEAD
eukprot:gene1273-1348_t